MVEKNEMVTTDGEILEKIIEDTENYTIVRTQDGKFKKNMKYHKYFSKIPETEEETIELFKVFNSDSNDGLVTSMKNAVGEKIGIEQVYMQPYESFDEDTGNVTNGVTTTILSTKGEYFATSSKSVYYSLKNIFDTFKYPNTSGYSPILVEVTSTKQQKGYQINLKLLGYEK